MSGALFLAAVLVSPATGESPIRVAPVRSAIAASTEIGKRGSGWTCFPAGSIRWRDLSFDATDAAETVARTLGENGVEAIAEQYAHGSADTPRRLVAATIRSAEVKACTPQHGIGKLFGGASKLKGRIALLVEWTVRLAGHAETAIVMRSEAELSTSDADLRALLETGLRKAAVDVSRELRDRPAD